MSTAGTRRRPTTRRRVRANPEEEVDESERLVASARALLQGQGSPEFTLQAVLQASGLGTRAFYRHFASKDELALAVFAQEAEREVRRVERKMKAARTPLEGVVAWVDARLELGFNQQLAATQRPLTEAATLASHQFPRQLEQTYNRTLEPLIARLAAGHADGTFHGIEPTADAKAVYHVVAGVIEERWAGIPLPRRATRAQVLRFCLSGLGVARPRIDALLRPPPAR